MALGGTDLNLLLPLKVLLEEGNVTRAGQRLELSQPAMSAALARLRRRFDDELLARAGRDYELTPFARDLLPEVQHALRLMGAALHLEDEFDPATSSRTFRLAMSDYAIAVVHEPLVRLVEAEAPGVRLSIGHLGPGVRESPTALIEHDALVAPLGIGFPGESRPFWRDRMVVMADRDNPRLVDGGLTLEDLAALPARGGVVRTRRADAGGPRLRRARDRAPDRTAGLRVPAAAVRHRGHRHDRRRPRDPRADPRAARRVGWWSSSHPSTSWCWPRATGSPPTGSPTPRTAGCSGGWTRSRTSLPAAADYSQWLRLVAPSGPAR